MTTLLSAEKYKLLHSHVTAIVLLGVAVTKTFFIWAPYLFLPPVAPPGNAAASGVAPALLGQNGVKLMGGESTILLIWFIAFVGFFVASEFQHGTIRNTLSLGKSRTRVFMSKILGVFATLAAILAITIVIAVAGRSLQYGFGDMGVVAFVGYFAWNYFLQLLFHLPYAAVFCMIAFISRNAGTSIIASVGYLIFNSVAQSFVGNFQGLMFAAKLFPEYYIGNVETLGGDTPFVVSSILVSIGYIVLACAIGCIAFKKHDVK